MPTKKMKHAKSPRLLIPELATRAPDQLGQALARYRALADLSQAAIAKSAGVRQATVSKAETGTGTTAVETIFALCTALGLELVLRPRGTKIGGFHPEDIF